jgi:hypothetical protein
LTAAACTRIRTFPGPVSGSGSSTMWSASGPPNSVTPTALMPSFNGSVRRIFHVVRRIFHVLRRIFRVVRRKFHVVRRVARPGPPRRSSVLGPGFYAAPNATADREAIT